MRISRLAAQRAPVLEIQRIALTGLVILCATIVSRTAQALPMLAVRAVRAADPADLF